jgi:hypothetical protein
MTAPERNQLTDWEDELFRVEQNVRLELEPLTDAQFGWRPGPARWSVGECLNHLAIATGLMLERVRPALERGRSEQRAGAAPFKLGLVGGWFARLMEQPGKRPMPAPGNFVPPSDVPKPQVLAAFYAVEQKFSNTLMAARGLARPDQGRLRGEGWKLDPAQPGGVVRGDSGAPATPRRAGETRDGDAGISAS